MGARLRYDTTRFFFFGTVLLVLYLVVLPAFWPAPGVKVRYPDAPRRGGNLPVEVTVSSWHTNYSVRQVSVGVNNVASDALVSRKTFVPVNIYQGKAVKSWDVGFAKRLSWPGKTVLELDFPLARLRREGVIGSGGLQGTFHVVVDHTRVTMKSGYPPLTHRQSLPYSIHLPP